jgi:SOS-response transcriptional repressor LexA
MRPLTPSVCRRLGEIRLKHYGTRGRSRFAQALGIRPSTYSHYESDRLPPADILLRAARLTGTRLEWLISGEGDPADPGGSPPIDESVGAPRADALADRVRRLISAEPELAAPLQEWLEERERRTATVAPAAEAPPRETLIPIVGSTAAGLARYWRELPESVDGPIADERLEALIASCTAAPHVEAAHFSSAADAEPVSLVQLAAPDERGILEFLSASAFAVAHPGCVAWRIDGASMSPRYADGDFVITSPHHPAESGHPCVARQRGQLGVNCKLYQQQGDTVWLIPLNPSTATQVVPASDIVWAWRVLATVRLTHPSRRAAAQD